MSINSLLSARLTICGVAELDNHCAADVTHVIDTGPRIAETYDCVRTDVGADTIFTDGLE